MEYNQDMLSLSDQPKKLPEMLNVLTILTFVGCAFAVLSTLFLPFGCKVLEMEEIVDKMESNEVEILQKSCENITLQIILLLLGAILCIIGALMMRKLNQSGFLIYIIGQIVPILSSTLILGLGMYSDWKQIVGLIFPIVFIILYVTQYKYLIGYKLEEQQNIKNDIFAMTELGTNNNVIVPLIYYMEESDVKIDQFKKQPFFMKGYNFHIAFIPNSAIFIFTHSNEEKINFSVLNKNMKGYIKVGIETFEAKKTSAVANAIQRGQAFAGAGGLIPMLAFKGLRKLLHGNKSEQHEGVAFHLNYEIEGTKKVIIILCETIYEESFTDLLSLYWLNNRQIDKDEHFL
jgi:hypothetical protein